MGKKSFVSEKVNTPEGTLSWVKVFEPEEKLSEDGKKRLLYKCDIIFDASQKAALQPLMDLGCVAAEAEWGPDDAKWPKFKTPIIRETSEKGPNPQTGKAWEGYEPGKYFIGCQSQYKPSIIDLSGRAIIDPNELYGGCKAIFCVNAYTYSYKGFGVKFGLISILKTGDGKPFGAERPDPTQIFKALIKPGATPSGGAPAPQPGRGSARQI